MARKQQNNNHFECLFKPGKIGSVTIKNRLVMAPMLTNFATVAGRITDRLIDYFEARAKGGVGAIFIGSIAVNPNGRVTPTQALISDDSCIPDFIKLYDRIKKHNTVVIQQIVHHGRNCPPDIVGGECLGPSPIPTLSYGFIPREMTVDEIKGLVVDFADGAERAINSGAHGIDIDAAHGHLIGQFLSPYSNKRADEYGGDLQKRIKFLVEIVSAIKARIGEKGVITCRFSADEYIDGGFTIEDSKILTKQIEAAGVDAIYVSAGVHDSKVEMIEATGAQPRGYLVGLAEKIADAATKPIIVGGRVNTPEVAEEILKKGKIDFISLGRPLLADPDYPRKACENRSGDIRACLSENRGCIEKLKPKYATATDFTYSGISCTVNPAVGRESELKIRRTEIPKNILIVGGGPAGMQAAMILSLRGHRVNLYERRNELGGNLAYIHVIPKKEEFKCYLKYLVEQISKLDLAVHLNTDMDLAMVEQLNPVPDAIILATGARLTEIRDVPANKTWEIEAVYSESNTEFPAQKIIVLGGDMIGTETAEYLAAKGKKVTIIEKDHEIGNLMTKTTRAEFLTRLNKYPIHVLTSASIDKLAKDKACVSVNGQEKEIEFDAIVNASDRRPNDALYRQLEGNRLYETYRIGDCLTPLTLLEAIHTATEIAHKL